MRPYVTGWRLIGRLVGLTVDEAKSRAQRERNPLPAVCLKLAGVSRPRADRAELLEWATHEARRRRWKSTPRAERKHISVRASTRALFVKAAVRDDVAPIHYLDAFITAELDKAGAP